MKTSIPIMPEIPREYNLAMELPKMEELSLVSLNLRNISQETSFISDS
jgi:hypothetical protein